MSSIDSTHIRHGNFTSSFIYLLMTRAKNKKDFGKPALTYIEEKKWELKLGRNLQKERSSRPTSFGNLVEPRVFDLLPSDYTLQSDVRYQHEEISNWTGAPDMLTKTKVCDIKAPYSLKVYCRKADIIIAKDLKALKAEFPENYWQLVSNSILTGKSIAELTIYCPYLSELVEIKSDLANYEGDQNDVAWINWAKDDELPYLLPDKYYKNLYQFEFEVPEADKILLYETVKKANAILNRNN